jgi:DNA repair exonuclease SbcCD nuclease subunit
MLSVVGKTLFFSDLHIGIRRDSLSRLLLSAKVIEEVCEIGKSRGIENVVYLGDYFNSREYINSVSLIVSHKLINLLAKTFKQVVVIVGNHDLVSDNLPGISPVNIFSNVNRVTVISKPTRFTFNGKAALAVPWGIETNQPLPFKDEEFNYIFGHFTPSTAAIRYNRINTQSIVNSKTYISAPKNDIVAFLKCLKPGGLCMSGHIHNRTGFDYKGKRVIFIGSPLVLNFGETDSTHGVFILDDQGETPEFIELDKIPKCMTIKISDFVDFSNNNELKNLDELKKFEGQIIRLNNDTELSVKQREEFNAALGQIRVFDILQPITTFKQFITMMGDDNSQGDKNKDGPGQVRFTMSGFIDKVLGLIDPDVINSADTTVGELKGLFNKYALEV